MAVLRLPPRTRYGTRTGSAIYSAARNAGDTPRAQGAARRREGCLRRRRIPRARLLPQQAAAAAKGLSVLEALRTCRCRRWPAASVASGTRGGRAPTSPWRPPWTRVGGRSSARRPTRRRQSAPPPPWSAAVRGPASPAAAATAALT